MTRVTRAIASLALAAMLIPAVRPATGQDLDTVKERIEQEQKKIQGMEARERQVLTRLDSTARELSEARREAAKSRKELAEVEERIEEAGRELNRLTAEVREKREYAKRRLVSYYKLTRLGLAPVLFSADSFYDFVRRQRALEQVLEKDREAWEELTSARQSLERTAMDLERQRASRLALKARLEEQIEGLRKRQGRRQNLLASIREERKTAESALESLREAAKRLERRIRSMPGEGSDGGQAFTGGDFEGLRGHMPWPVDGGVIVSGYGKYRDPALDVVHFRSGIEIEAELGEPIHSVATGRVVYAKWFKGYGNMMIIDHGGGYFTVSAHAEDLFKQKGDPVEAGEVIGTVGDTGSLAGPGLYFEIRLHGKSLNPADWLRKGNS
ncbi:MAG: murein hydrolase activator EnvC family protein [Desulfatibacillaceae bacterium]